MRGGSEIVEVPGGHIVRSAGRMDRRSKVCTAKGTRDRRIRLSAHTAIQFYDVQDRLGCDRPSKAVDWLIKNAKAAIDELAELPAWHSPAAVNPAQEKHSRKPIQAAEDTVSSPLSFAVAGGDGVGGENSSFLPLSLDSDAIADTIKSFFPVTAGAAAAAASSSSNRSQDLHLSLQSFQSPIFHHNSAVFSDHGHSSFNAAAPSFSEQNERIVSCDIASSGGDGGGYDYSVLLPPAVTLQPLLFGRSHFLHRGEPFSPVTCPRLVRGRTSLSISYIQRLPPLISPPVVDAAYRNSTSGHGHRARRSTMASLTSRLPSPVVLNINGDGTMANLQPTFSSPFAL